MVRAPGKSAGARRRTRARQHRAGIDAYAAAATTLRAATGSAGSPIGGQGDPDPRRRVFAAWWRAWVAVLLVGYVPGTLPALGLAVLGFLARFLLWAGLLGWFVSLGGWQR